MRRLGIPSRQHSGRRENWEAVKDRYGRSEGWRRGWESNPRIKVLQTSPLPLGYRAFREKEKYGAGNGIRTRDFDLGKVALYH
jgi:hypothetical protein